MNRTKLAIGFTAAALLSVTACSSDSKSTVKSPNDTSGDVVTLPDGVTIPDDALPGNLTEECKAIALEFSTMLASAFAPEGQQADIEKAFGNVQAKVPDDLKADVAVVAEAFTKYAQLVKEKGNDFTNPDVQAAVQELSTPEIQAASDRVQKYFDTTCPGA